MNTEKYGPENTPYFNTFHEVLLGIDKMHVLFSFLYFSKTFLLYLHQMAIY